VKTGIQDQESEIWIPASAGMTTFLNIFFSFFKALNGYEYLRSCPIMEVTDGKG
jgi:hypothetical protein